MTSVQKIGKQRSDLQVFRRWSRKSYAVFASINREIKISNMNAKYNLLVPSKESGFSGFCFLPESGRDKNEVDDPDLIVSEIIELLVIQNESRKITIGKESGKRSGKVLSNYILSYPKN